MCLIQPVLFMDNTSSTSTSIKQGERYVNFTNNTRYAYNELCELEVYGKPLYSKSVHLYYLFNQIIIFLDLLDYEPQRNIIDMHISIINRM